MIYHDYYEAEVMMAALLASLSCYEEQMKEQIRREGPDNMKALKKYESS